MTAAIDVLTRANKRATTVANTAYYDSRLRQAGVGDTIRAGMETTFSLYGESQASKKSYARYRGWLYAAVHALASGASKQPPCLARILSDEPVQDLRGVFLRIKSMTETRRRQLESKKNVRQEYENIIDHYLLKVMQQPNPWQNQWQFIYTFVANLNLTGKAPIVREYVASDDEDVQEEIRFYSIPSSWLRQDNKGQYYMTNPKKPSETIPLPDDAVAVATMPNPADPLGCVSPADTQSNAIKIDDYIQAGQMVFFENGIFPGVLVTIGRNPTGAGDTGGAGGIRPRLTNAQRRGIVSAIKSNMGGVYRNGVPAIIDGLIERIDKFTMTSQEMDWLNSERSVRTRILSAYGVNPFVLGEMAPASYAQAKIVMDQFNSRVNTFLEMLGVIMTEMVGDIYDDDLVMWFEPAVAVDPQQRSNDGHTLYRNGGMTRAEYREWFGLPVDDMPERSAVLDNPNTLSSIVQLLNQVSMGAIDAEAAAQALALVLNLPVEQVRPITSASTEMDIFGQAIGALQDAINAGQAAVQLIGSK